MSDEQNQPVDIFAEVDTPTMVGGQSFNQSPAGLNPSTMEPAHHRRPSKFLFVAVVLVLLIAISGGIKYLFLRKVASTTPVAPVVTNNINSNTEVSPIQPNLPVCGDGVCVESEKLTCVQDCPVPVSSCGNNVCEMNETAENCPLDCQSLPPTEPVIEPEPANQPVDSDSDGLIDDEEQVRGTNPLMADTDSDGLTDREEIFIYKTDPLKPDTDGDGYLDGEEVKAGYDPNGPGKLLNLPQ